MAKGVLRSPRGLIVAAALVLSSLNATALAGDISPLGRRLASVLDSMKVEEHWLAGVHVNWRTGDPDGQPIKTEGAHTHCSAFVAAVAETLGIDLLRPPEHSLVLLANAQHDWLREKGPEHGWRRVKDAEQAQELANQGELVLASCKSPDPEKSGHIAIVRPATKSEAQIHIEGPEIIQAGTHNHERTTVKEGFRSHPGAFKNDEILYFAHHLPQAPEGPALR
jgi:hypothetical protein